MTVTSENRRNQYDCDGSQKVFPYTFRILDEEDIQVIHTDSDGNEVSLTLDSDYTVSGVGDQGGGNITTTVAYPSGDKLTFLRDVSFTQLIDYVENDKFPAESHERGLDKLTMIMQQFAERLDRLLYLKKSSAFSNLELPDPVAEKILQWKSDLSGFKNVTPYDEGMLTVTAYVMTLLDDEDASEFLGTLGVSSYIKTLLDDVDAAAASETLTALLKRNFANVYAVASGTDTYVATLTPAISSYVAGCHYFITFTNANTIAAPTLNLNSLGAKTIKKEGGDALLVGNIPANHAGMLKYDGTDMILLNPKSLVGGAITGSMLGSAIISQAKLKTDQGNVSVTDGPSQRVLPGGEYGFYPQIKVGGGAMNAWIAYDYPTNPTYATNITLQRTGAAGTAYAQQRYVTSSGEIYWVFILRDKSSKEILGMYQAPDHPCFGNGGKPRLTPHPFPGFDINTQEIVVITMDPSSEELNEMKQKCAVKDEGKPNRDLLEVITEDYEVDEQSTPLWPSKKITVALPADWDEAWRTGKLVSPIKKKIPKPEYILHKALKLRD